MELFDQQIISVCQKIWLSSFKKWNTTSTINSGFYLSKHWDILTFLEQTYKPNICKIGFFKKFLYIFPHIASYEEWWNWANFVIAIVVIKIYAIWLVDKMHLNVGSLWAPMGQKIWLSCSLVITSTLRIKHSSISIGISKNQNHQWSILLIDSDEW